jgi:hypothetical protein
VDELEGALRDELFGKKPRKRMLKKRSPDFVNFTDSTVGATYTNAATYNTTTGETVHPVRNLNLNH